MRKTALDMVHELAQRDPRVLFIGSDLGAGTLDAFKREFPDRFFMEGVSEANIIGMAGGLAMSGFIPYINTIAPFFTRRALEQITIDLCLHKLPVRLIASGGGVVYAPLGPTHLAFEDMATLRAIPGMTVVAPCDAPQMGRLMARTLDWPGPIYIRLAKGGDAVVSSPDEEFAIGKAITMRPAGAAMIVATGTAVQRALAAAELLATRGIACGVANMHTVKPLDDAAVLQWADEVELLVTLEEHTLIGGLGGAVAELLVDRHAAPPRLLRLGLPDAFPKEYGSQESMMDSFGLAPAAVAARIAETLEGVAARKRR